MQRPAAPDRAERAMAMMEPIDWPAHARLGEPERWSDIGGHVLAAWALSRNPDRIIEWLERE